MNDKGKSRYIRFNLFLESSVCMTYSILRNYISKNEEMLMEFADSINLSKQT